MPRLIDGNSGKTATNLAANNRPTSRVSAVIEAISGHIMSGEFSAGRQLPVEDALSKAFDVSRTPLREGVKILAAAGVLEVRRGVGTFVAQNARAALFQFQLLETQLGEASLHEMVETRFMLERTAAELAARNRTDDDVEAISAANERLKQLSADDSTSLDDILDADIAFHAAIYAATGNRLIGTLGRLVTELFRPWIRDSLKRAGGTAAAGTHEPVLAMIALGNPDAARESWTTQVVSEGMQHWHRSLETEENMQDRTRSETIKGSRNEAQK